MSDCCLIKKVATVEVYENKNEVRAYGFMAGDKNTPMMEVKFRHLWGEENLSKCKLRWIIVDDLGSLLVGEVPIEQDNTASIQLPNELFNGERRMKVQLTVASCDGSRILNLQQFTDLKVINNLATNEVVEPVYQMLINQVYDDTKKYLAELETSYKAKYGSLESVYAKSKASLEQYLITAENGGNAEFLQGYNPKNFNRVENTINELTNSASSKYKVGDVIEVLGYYTAGDGAHHKRKIESADDGSGVQLANGLWANIVHNGEVNVSWFGAKGDGVTDDSASISKCHDLANKTFAKVKYDCKKYKLCKNIINIKTDTVFSEATFVLVEKEIVENIGAGTKIIRISNTKKTLIADSINIFDVLEVPSLSNKIGYVSSSNLFEESVGGYYVKDEIKFSFVKEGLLYDYIKPFETIGKVENYLLEKESSLNLVGKLNIEFTPDTETHTCGAVEVSLIDSKVEVDVRLTMETYNTKQRVLVSFSHCVNSFLCISSEPLLHPNIGSYSYQLDSSYNVELKTFDKMNKQNEWPCLMLGANAKVKIVSSFLNRVDSHGVVRDLEICDCVINRSFMTTSTIGIFANIKGTLVIESTKALGVFSFYQARPNSVGLKKVNFPETIKILNCCLDLESLEDTSYNSKNFVNLEGLDRDIFLEIIDSEITNGKTKKENVNFVRINTTSDNLSVNIKIDNVKLRDVISDRYLVKVDGCGNDLKVNCNIKNYTVPNVCLNSTDSKNDFMYLSNNALGDKIVSNFNIENCVVKITSYTKGFYNLKNSKIQHLFLARSKREAFFNFEDCVIETNMLDTADLLMHTTKSMTFKRVVFNQPKINNVTMLESSNVSFGTDYKIHDFLCSFCYGTPVGFFEGKVQDSTKYINWRAGFSSVVALDTPYHTTKMQQEGVYEDFIQYMDEKTEYDRVQGERPEGVMVLPVIEEPQPSEALLKFKEKYLG